MRHLFLAACAAALLAPAAAAAPRGAVFGVRAVGNPKLGYFVYTVTGTVSIQAMRTPPVGPLAGEPVNLTSLDALTPFYFGYFGTYTILSDSTVVHHVQGGTFPDYIGTDQFRRYSIRGDTLSIGDPSFPCRVLLRVR